MPLKMPAAYQIKTLVAYLAILGIVTIAILELDKQRHAEIPPKISLEPDSLSMSLNLSQTTVKLVKIKFEENPIVVEPFLQGSGLKEFVNLVKTKNSDKEYSLYVNATNPGDNKRPMVLEGYVQVNYSFSDKTQHDKTIPLDLNLFIRNSTSSK